MVGGNLAFKTLQSYQSIGRRVSPPYAGVHRYEDTYVAAVMCLPRTRGFTEHPRGLPVHGVFPVRGGSPCMPVGIFRSAVSSPYAGVHLRSSICRMVQRCKQLASVFPVRGGSPTKAAPHCEASVFPVRGGSPMPATRCCRRQCLPRTRGFTV